MSTTITDYFTEQEISELSQEASRSEELGKLTSTTVGILKEKELLNLFVPKLYGGLQRDLPKALPWLEATSWVDGSLGWTLTLASGAGLFGGYIIPEFARSVFSQQNTFIAGSGFPGGKAEKTDSGFRINGSWKYASGIDHATLITATCYLTKDGAIVREDGERVTKAVAFYPDEIAINNRWNSMGLKATGSHHFEVQDVQVPRKRIFSISPDSVTVDGLLYQYPFETFAHCTLAVSMLGIAGRFLDEAKQILFSKNDVSNLNGLPDSLQAKFNNSNLTFKKAREAVYKIVEISWQELLKSNNIEETQADKVSSQSRKSCQTALHCVQELYPLLGMSAINPDTVINRCWRDLHTASQHMLLRPQE